MALVHLPLTGCTSSPGRSPGRAAGGVGPASRGQELHFPVPPASEAVHCRSSTAYCPRALRQCIARVALPTAPRQRSIALQEFHCPLPPGQ